MIISGFFLLNIGIDNRTLFIFDKNLVKQNKLGEIKEKLMVPVMIICNFKKPLYAKISIPKLQQNSLKGFVWSSMN